MSNAETSRRVSPLTQMVILAGCALLLWCAFGGCENGQQQVVYKPVLEPSLVSPLQTQTVEVPGQIEVQPHSRAEILVRQKKAGPAEGEEQTADIELQITRAPTFYLVMAKGPKDVPMEMVRQAVLDHITEWIERHPDSEIQSVSHAYAPGSEALFSVMLQLKVPPEPNDI